MTEQFANLAATTLAAAITSTSQTTIQVASTTNFPSSGNFRIVVGTELLLVTAVSGQNWTATRGVEGTVAATYAIGAPITHVLTAASLILAVQQNLSWANVQNAPAITSCSPSCFDAAGAAAAILPSTSGCCGLLCNCSGTLSWQTPSAATNVVTVNPAGICCMCGYTNATCNGTCNYCSMILPFGSYYCVNATTYCNGMYALCHKCGITGWNYMCCCYSPNCGCNWFLTDACGNGAFYSATLTGCYSGVGMSSSGGPYGYGNGWYGLGSACMQCFPP
jgi:hypothetical protein